MKIASKRAIQKIAEATGDLIGKKIADKVTGTAPMWTKKTAETYRPPEKRQQNIDELRLI